jgi:hypothetical protein
VSALSIAVAMLTCVLAGALLRAYFDAVLTTGCFATGEGSFHLNW